MLDAYASERAAGRLSALVATARSSSATSSAYRSGQQGLAYEIVINSDPCIAYLMEENTDGYAGAGRRARELRPQLVFSRATISPAMSTPPVRSSITCLFARRYVMECEEKHGAAESKPLLDSCHALMRYGVDRCRRPAPLTL